MFLAAATSAGAQATKSAKTQTAKAGTTSATSPDSIVVAQERAIADALTRNDFPAMNRALGSDFVYMGANGAVQWERSKTADLLKGCTSGQWTLDNVKTKRVGTDLVVVTFTATGEQTCNGQKAPSPVYAMSVWRKQGTHWVAVAHSETPAAPQQ
jgi:hypothetical protein